MHKQLLVRITTVPISLDKLLEGQLLFMSKYYNVTAISSDEKELVKIGKRENASTFSVDMTRKITPIQDFFAIIKLFFFIRKYKPFIVHSHTPKAGLVAMIAAKIAGVPMRLHTVAGLPLLEATGFKRIILVWVEKITFLCATNVYPNSNELLKILKSEKIGSNRKLKVLGNGSSNGINTTYFDSVHYSENENNSLKQNLSINEADFVFIFVGRLVSDKGINELVEAFKQINSKFPITKLLLVGAIESDLDPLMPSTLNEIQTNSFIISVGYQKDVRPYFSISNALVFPSYREGFPNVVMQAGAMGLPSIVTDINGCNEIIINNENGLIIPVKNTQAIEEAMSKIVHEQELFQHLKNNARKRIVENYEQSVVWNAILQEYKNVEQHV